MRKKRKLPLIETPLERTYDTKDSVAKNIESIREGEIQPKKVDLYPRVQKKEIPALLYFTPPNETKYRFYINPQMETLLDFPPSEWTDPGFWIRHLHPGDHERVLVDIHECLMNGSPFRSDYRLLARDGHTVWVHDEGTVVCEKADQPCYMQGIMVDITEYKHREEALQRSEARFRAVFERIAAGVALTDLEGRFTESNQVLQEMLGYSAEELRLRMFTEFTHPEDAPADLGLYRDLVDEKRDHYEMEIRYVRRDGGLIWGYLNVSLVRSQRGEPQFTIRMAEDITEQKRLEGRFFHSQKMETVGRLAAGIAHDFNNHLTVIKGNSQLSLVNLREDDPLKRNLEEILNATERAEGLTRQLLAFSRRQVTEMKVIDLNVSLRNLKKMLDRVIGEDIELIMILADDLGRVKTDPGQIENMILNLAVNARDAMPGEGKLTLETANVQLDELYAQSHISVIPGPYVRLSVSDTGCGMTPEVMDRIFDPFFTTKEKGQGTGLGLSTVYGIVKQSGGNIWVYSEPGYGTTFKIYLPQVREDTDAPVSQNDASELPRGNETVLIVEDESSVRSLAAHVLREQGYTVWEAANGEEAIQKVREHREKIQLLVTDVVMPQMGGERVFERLKAELSNLKVLFMSGYSNVIIRHHNLSKSNIPFLEKPFSQKALALKVREILDAN